MRRMALCMVLPALALSSATGAGWADEGPGARPALYDRAAGFAGGFVQVQAQSGAGVVGKTFASALTRSRDAARAESRPMPPEIRQALAPVYPAGMLDKVRFAVGDYSPDGLAGFAIRHGRAAAVTLVDTVVFKDERYVNNIALWAHELHHVEQYAEWGVDGFASRYAFGWRSVEQAATDRADEVIGLYRSQQR
jgi:hypothetical protein